VPEFPAGTVRVLLRLVAVQILALLQVAVPQFVSTVIGDGAAPPVAGPPAFNSMLIAKKLVSKKTFIIC
jgi:hypothetical protein